VETIDVSIVVPAYNAAATIEQCIESLQNQQATHLSYEIIVVDNNSTDDTPIRIRKYPDVIYQFEARQGASSARNKGIDVARGRIIAFTDADCVATEGWLQQMVACLDNNDCDVCGGAIRPVSVASEIERFGEAWFWPIEKIIAGELFHYPFVITANAAYRKTIIDEVGGFDSRFPVAGYEDTDLGWRSYFAGARFCHEPDAIVMHHHRTTLRGLYYMGYKGAFGREILIDKFIDKGVVPQSLWRHFARLPVIVVSRLLFRQKNNGKRSWLLYELTFRTGQLFGAYKGRQYLKRSRRQSHGSDY
jgi:glycosyltransferase involved in cell wall biosynthesis